MQTPADTDKVMRGTIGAGYFARTSRFAAPAGGDLGQEDREMVRPEHLRTCFQAWAASAYSGRSQQIAHCVAACTAGSPTWLPLRRMRWAVVAGATAHRCSSHTTTHRLSWDPSPPPARKSWYSTGAPVNHGLPCERLRSKTCDLQHNEAYQVHAVQLTCFDLLADRHRKFAASSNPTVFAPPLLLWLPKEDIARSLESAQAVRCTVNTLCVAHCIICACTLSISVIGQQSAAHKSVAALCTTGGVGEAQLFLRSPRQRVHRQQQHRSWHSHPGSPAVRLPSE